MNSTRRTHVVIAISMIAAASLAVNGCSAGGGPSEEPPADLDTSAQDFLRDRGEAIGESSVSVLAMAAPQAESIAALAPQFTELTGIDVEFTILDEQSMENRAAVALGSGSSGYDVVQTTTPRLPTYAERGWIEPFDSRIADEDSIVPGWNVDAFGDGMLDLMIADEGVYAIPMFLGTQIFYYRKDLFEAAGITHPPSTYEELAEAAEALSDGDVAGIALRTAPSASQLMYVWSAWLYAFGGKYYERYSDGEYSGAALDSPEALAALELYVDLMQNCAPSGATNWSVEDVTRAFMAGRVAMVQEGIVFGGPFNDPSVSAVAENIDTFALPAGPAGRYVPYAAQGWGITADSRNGDAAWLFVQWATLASTLTSASTSDANFASPPLSEVYGTPEFQDRYGFGDYVDSINGTIDAADEGGVSPYDGDSNYLPAIAEWATIGQQISEELSKAVTGQETPADALSNANEYLR